MSSRTEGRRKGRIVWKRRQGKWVEDGKGRGEKGVPRKETEQKLGYIYMFVCLFVICVNVHVCVCVCV